MKKSWKQTIFLLLMSFIVQLACSYTYAGFMDEWPIKCAKLKQTLQAPARTTSMRLESSGLLSSSSSSSIDPALSACKEELDSVIAWASSLLEPDSRIVVSIHNNRFRWRDSFLLPLWQAFKELETLGGSASDLSDTRIALTDLQELIIDALSKGRISLGGIEVFAPVRPSNLVVSTGSLVSGLRVPASLQSMYDMFCKICEDWFVTEALKESNKAGWEAYRNEIAICEVTMTRAAAMVSVERIAAETDAEEITALRAKVLELQTQLSALSSI